MFVLDLIIAVTIVFIAFVNSDSIDFVKIYSQEQEQIQTQINQTFIGYLYVSVISLSKLAINH
jgi:hypothetical protein